jgi:hypothetical protein
MHLSMAHMEELWPCVEVLPRAYTEQERLVAAYNEAIAEKIREGAPLATYSIDRRCMRQYAGATSGDNIEELVCFFCACEYTHARWRRINDISWHQPVGSGGSLCAFDAASAVDIFSLQSFLNRYGYCGDDAPKDSAHHHRNIHSGLKKTAN